MSRWRAQITIGEPSFERLEDVAELIREAAENGALLIHFGDGQRPPPWYWRSDPGLASVERGYFAARYSRIFPDYDGKRLFAGEINFARWLAGVPKHGRDRHPRGKQAQKPWNYQKAVAHRSREALARVREELYGERSNWPGASKHLLVQVNMWLEERRLGGQHGHSQRTIAASTSAQKKAIERICAYLALRIP